MFFDKGVVDIGFEINHKKQYVLRLSKNIAVGAYNMSMGKRTKFIYFAKTYCSGYSIRRFNWMKIIQEDEFKSLTRCLVQSFKEYYDKTILVTMTEEKEKAVQKWQKRKDFQSILAVRDVDNEYCDSCHTIGGGNNEDSGWDIGDNLMGVINKVDSIQARSS